MKYSLYILSLALLITVSACSGSKKSDATFGKWQVMTASTDKNTQLCYAGSWPVKTAGTVEKREQPYLMITRRQSGKIEVSASSGYPYMHGSKATIVIDGKAHPLFFKDTITWAKSDAEDIELIKLIKTGKNIEVHGVSETKQTSVDTYSSIGFADAVARVRKLCP